MNVYDEMNNLCKAIKESHEYKVLVEAKGKLAKDSSAESMVKDFLKQKQELELQQYQGQKPDDAKVKKMQDLYNVLQLNPVAADYIQGYIRFQMMIGDLSKTLSDTLKEALEYWAYPHCFLSWKRNCQENTRSMPRWSGIPPSEWAALQICWWNRKARKKSASCSGKSIPKRSP